MGEFFVTILGLAPSAGMPELVPPTVVAAIEERLITTKKGELTVLGIGVLDTGTEANSEFDLLSRISSGTGRFDGATGILHIRGQGHGPGSFIGRVEGEICLPRRNPDDK
jgi:hypothetical protein